MARADACSSVMHPAVTTGDAPANLGGRLEERCIVWPSRCHEPHQPSNRDDHHRQANDQLLPRHGWGCEPNPAAAIEYLSAAASNAAEIENLALQAGLKKGGAAKGELVLAIFELANCFRHGWGIPKDAIAAKQVRRISDHETIRPSLPPVMGDDGQPFFPCGLDGIEVKRIPRHPVAPPTAFHRSDRLVCSRSS